MVLSLKPTSGKRTLVLPGGRCHGLCSVSRTATSGTVYLTGGVVAGVASMLKYSNCGVIRGGRRTTKRAMFRFRVRLVPECGGSGMNLK